MTHPKLDNVITSWRDVQGNGLLHMIARSGNESILTYLLSKKYCDVELVNLRGETPLLMADYTHPNIVRIMLESGAKVNVFNDNGQSPLHLAVLAKSEENVTLLLDAGVDMTLVDMQDKSALYIAVESSMMEITKLLLDRGADVNQEFDESRSVLSIAARARNVAMMRLLLDYGANVSHINPDYTSPLHFAVWLDDCSISRLMIEQGANINQQDSDGFAVFHEAVYEGNFQQVKLLGEFKADINTRTNEGDTPLHWAVFSNIHDSPDVVKYLLEQGANVNDPNYQGTTPLHYAAKRCCLQVFEMCLEFGGDINIRNQKNETVLHFAAENEDTDVLDFVMEKRRFKVDERNFTGFTPLHYAAEAGNIEACAYLLSEGADINAKSDHGNSPLYLATRMRQVEVMKFLLKHGAGMLDSVMDAVEEEGYQQMSIILVKHLAKLECLGIGMTHSDFKRVQSDEDLDVYLGVCEYELDRMRGAKIYGNISMFDVLTKSINVIGGYARNEQLVRAFEEKNDLWMFPNYGEDMSERFMEEVRRQKVISDASIVLNSILPFDPRHIVMEKIVSYLGFDDLTFLAMELDEMEDDGEKEDFLNK